MNFKNNLRKIRKDNNLSQEELADKLNVSRQAVSKWESGQAYPEMDKVLQICKMFNLNIDDLLNKDIREVNEVKESKTNINKYIDDFLGYVTKTVNVFSSMKIRGIIKCLLEQFCILIVIWVFCMVIGTAGDHIVRGIFGGLPSNIYHFIYNILESIYIIAAIIFGIMMIAHIFKVRYLDYYEVVEEEPVKELKEESKEKEVVYLTKEKEKIVIRDPKHAGYGFINGLVKCILLIIKFFVLWFIVCAAITLISLVMVTVILFIFIKTGLLFFGIFLILLSFIAINIIILDIFYNFVINKKSKFKTIGIILLISLISMGIGSGLIFIGIKDFDIPTTIDHVNYISKTIHLDMEDNLLIDYSCCYDIEYITEVRDDIKLELIHTKYNDIDIIKNDNIINFDIDYKDEDIMDMLRTQIEDINNKVFIDYGKISIKVYASKENMSKLFTNYDNYMRKNQIYYGE
ncbi:MAG: helix-turn-helix transcriptional regulator [Bacilli bacterium]|nr:helix-turn-helix transcriptional regulator [Bacilli bacterium]